MEPASHPRTSPKKAANLTANAELLREAKALGVNLSKVFETALADAVRQRQRERWLEENRAALEAYNRHIEQDGVFSDGLRSF